MSAHSAGIVADWVQPKMAAGCVHRLAGAVCPPKLSKEHSFGWFLMLYVSAILVLSTRHQYFQKNNDCSPVPALQRQYAIYSKLLNNGKATAGPVTHEKLKSQKELTGHLELVLVLLLAGDVEINPGPPPPPLPPLVQSTIQSVSSMNDGQLAGTSINSISQGCSPMCVMSRPLVSTRTPGDLGVMIGGSPLGPLTAAPGSSGLVPRHGDRRRPPPPQQGLGTRLNLYGLPSGHNGSTPLAPTSDFTSASEPFVGRVKPTRPASAGSCTGVHGESPRQRVTGVHQKENREWDGYQGHGTRRLSCAIQTHKICKDCALCKRHQVLE
ncbi:uncharacterized protein LOC129347845 [Amphiprion ocellaris]|uniref:uncharacterized protein LOC129347845 n=1 Tax=Amphiprion ocellaris TaxID=80972 RepID=UPI0024114035|nr:uncharacterized protein LOC129347845 [Amphiprion ocellaris]